MDLEGSERYVFLETSCEWLGIVQQFGIEIHDRDFCDEIIKVLEARGFTCRKDSAHSCLVRAAKGLSDQPAEV
jgi:hypothetical protein